MLKAVLGKKLRMTQVFDSHGRSVPVTAILAAANLVTAVKDKEIDGYQAIQIGFGNTKKIGKSLKGSLRKATAKSDSYPKVLKEVAFDDSVKVGQKIKVDEVFSIGTMVDVEGVSRGKGFAGGVKRWGFHGGPKTHGQSDRHRAPGSIGSGTTPGRVVKGLKMAGHMGVDQVTIQGLEVMGIDVEKEVILIKGSIPGPSGSVVLIKKSQKKRKKYHEPVIQNISLGGDEEEKAEEGETTTEGEVKAEEGTIAEAVEDVKKEETEVKEKAGEENAES